MITQTEEAVFAIAAGGSSNDYVPEPLSFKDDVDASATDSGESSPVPESASALEDVVLGVIRPFGKAHRRASVRVPERPLKFVVPRSRQVTKGGYASLDSPGEGDVELQRRPQKKAGDSTGGEAVNPLWQDGEDEQNA
jgi:hypothetical protein